MSVFANVAGKSGNGARVLDWGGGPLFGIVVSLLVFALAVGDAAAGWDAGSQRATDGHETVAGNVYSDTDLTRSVSMADSDGGDAEAREAYSEPASQSESSGDDADLAPGDWALAFGLDNQIFPAAIIALSTLDPENIGVQQPENSFGSPLGMASVYIRAVNPGDEVTVEISSTRLIQPSRMTVTLPDTETVYEISPHLKYEYEKLLSVRQPYPEDVTAKVFVNGEQVGEHSRTIIIRSVNDCFFGVYSEDGEQFQDWSEMFAAYVNEGDPIIDDILSEALRKGYVDAFIGYQGGEQDVVAQVDAIWRVLKDMGFRYSSITTTSVESEIVAAQHVRLVGDSTRGAQANCADGSVLLASIFRKIGLDAYLILLPGHMMVGVSVNPDEDGSVIPIETTMLSSAELEEAEQSGINTISGYESDPSAVTYISVNGARAAGILPLRNIY